MITLTIPHTWSTAAQAQAGDCIWHDGQLWDITATNHNREQDVWLDLTDITGQEARSIKVEASQVFGYLIEDGRDMV